MASVTVKQKPSLSLVRLVVCLSALYPVVFRLFFAERVRDVWFVATSVDTSNATNKNGRSIITSWDENDESWEINVHSTALKVNQWWPPTYQFWNHTTQRLNLPSDYEILSNHRPSLELLQSIIDNEEFQNRSIPLSDSCYYPDIDTTRTLADQVAQGQLTLSLPVLNVGMPKVGSTTLLSFFLCAGKRATHSQAGHTIRSLIDQGVQKPIKMSEDGRYRDAYLQLDNNGKGCAFPQIEFLDEIHHELPSATFILNFRPVADWIQSAKNYNDLAARWRKCVLPGLVCTGDKDYRGNYICTDADLSHWWCGHVKHIRKFVKEYPSHQLIELDLYNNAETAEQLSRLFQSNKTCWGHENANRNTDGNATPAKV